MAFLGLDPSRPGSTARARPLAPQHFQPPAPRDLRAQAVHRLQIGLLGLAGMLLLVGLANIIMDRARSSDDATADRAAASAAARVVPKSGPESPASDPLADMGVVPDIPADEPAPPGRAAPGATRR